MMIKDPSVKSLLDKYMTVYALKNLIMLSEWDIETYMPKNGIKTRGMVNSKIEALIQNLLLDPEFVIDLKAIKHAENKSRLTDSEHAVIRQLWHSYERYQKLPKQFVEDYSNLTSIASTVWAKAKAENDLNLFVPYMEKIFSMTRKFADYIGYKDHPYEALIEDYEPGMNINDYNEYFGQLKNILSKFDINKDKTLVKISSEFSISKLKEICRRILFLFKADELSLRIDESAHPFSNALAINDIRITTNYNKPSPFSAIFSTVHEFGHGLFGLQCSPELEFTPLFDDISYALHESQSRYWENIIGRTQQFSKWLTPMIKNLGKDFENLSEKEIYESVNHVKPSLVRIEADELTYHYHILIRYEIEKALLEGSVKPKDAAELWDAKYKEYLGVSSDGPADGVLQDIHWSMGYIGYFPSYSMGTVLSSTIDEAIKSKHKNIEKDLLSDNSIKLIQGWLKENIHQYAGTYTYKEISKKFTGKEINLEPWEKYVKSKFNHLLKTNGSD